MQRFFKKELNPFFIRLFLPALVLSGCSRTLAAENLLEDYSSQVTPKADTQSFRTYTDFAIELFEECDPQNQTVLISPLSVMIAMGMTENGAEGSTLTQMEDVFGMDLESLNNVLGVFQEDLSGESLQMADSLWIDDREDVEIFPIFLQKVADYYRAEIYTSSFSEETRQDINLWVSEKTDGMIEELIDQIDEDAIMYLVNALSFKSDWASVYREWQVEQGEFNNMDGSSSTVEFLNSQEYQYLENEQLRGFIKNYEDMNFAFVALLPESSIEDGLASLKDSGWDELMDSLQNTTVITQMPKFESEYENELSEVFKKLGITNAFDAELADFTAMGKSMMGNIYINRILHKTKISVTEQGTKAGAATAVEMVTESAAEIVEPKEVILDRPFIYALIEREHNTPVFIGTLTELN